jgi:hypothetical protein
MFCIFHQILFERTSEEWTGGGEAFSMCEGETHTEIVNIFIFYTRSRR